MMFKIGGMAGMRINIKADVDILAKYKGSKVQNRIIILYNGHTSAISIILRLYCSKFPNDNTLVVNTLVLVCKNLVSSVKVHLFSLLPLYIEENIIAFL